MLLCRKQSLSVVAVDVRCDRGVLLSNQVDDLPELSEPWVSEAFPSTQRHVSPDRELAALVASSGTWLRSLGYRDWTAFTASLPDAGT